MGLYRADQQFSTSDRWLFLGHILTAVGGMAIAIGTTIRLANEGKMSERPYFDNPLVFNKPTQGDDRKNYGRSYFD